MRVLIIDDVTDDATRAADLVARGGHTPTSCRPMTPGGLCRGLDPRGRCPIDEGVDVALAPFPLDELDEHGLALGYVCARRARIPVVAIGDHDGANPDPGTTVLVHDRHDLAEVLVGAARRPLEEHTAVARRAVRASLDGHGLDDVDSSAWVERHDGRLTIRLTTSEPVAPSASHAAAVRAVAAVRELDDTASSISVSVG